LRDEETQNKIAQCGVDLDQVMNEFLIASLNANGSGEDDLQALYFDFIQSLAEEGEEDCTDKQVEEYGKASVDFLKCLGWQDKVTELSPELFEGIGEACGEMDPQDDQAMEKCTDAIFGNDVLGDLLRDLYHHPDKFCECSASLKDATPECFLTIPGIDNAKLPLSVFKKELCLIGIACDAIDNVCASEIKSLDECLPPTDETTFSCLEVMEQCQLLESPPISILAPPEITASQLPYPCERVQAESFSDTNVVERYTIFNNVCNNNAVSAPEAQSNDSELVSSSSGADDPVESGSTSTTALLAGVAGIFIVTLIAALVLVVKKIRANRQQDVHFDAITDDQAELI